VSLVLDSSITLAWLFSDEGTPATQAVLDTVAGAGAHVPVIWPIEVANGLMQGVRRGRMTPSLRDASLSDLTRLDVAIDPDTNRFAWTATSKLADRFRLTLYDACYLELAQRRGLPLATLDYDLRNAGSALGLELLGVGA
jgi:predicted nucleic acid-binding protein